MIYIIDDDRFVRRGFEFLLKSEGFESRGFESAEEFLLKCQPGESDLLILDIQMPGMSGCDLLVNFSVNGICIPVIVVTAFDEPASRECAEKYGVLAFLKKPVDGEDLISLIKQSFAISKQ